MSKSCIASSYDVSPVQICPGILIYILLYCGLFSHLSDNLKVFDAERPHFIIAVLIYVDTNYNKILLEARGWKRFCHAAQRDAPLSVFTDSHASLEGPHPIGATGKIPILPFLLDAPMMCNYNCTKNLKY